MKCIVVGRYVAALALLALVPAAAHGQNTSAPTKVAYVNTRTILERMPEYAKAESLYNKEAAAAQDQATKLRSSVDSANSELERQSSMLNATQRTAKQKSFQEYVQSIQQKLRGLDSTMNVRQRDLLEPIQSRINSVIEGVRAAGGYAIIFDVSAPNSNILTADRSLDLTEKVIQQLK